MKLYRNNNLPKLKHKKNLSLFLNNSQPCNLPTSPIITDVTVSNQSAQIFFSQPLSPSILPIINYAYSLTGSNGPFLYLYPPQITSPITINGLTNGQSYDIYLQAINGVSNNSNEEPNIIPGTVPSPPIDLSGNALNNSANIYFTPGDNGGSAITNYKYSLNSGSFNLFNPSQTTSPVTITGLTNGTVYVISLEAVNTFGSSSPSTTITITPGVPSPPTNLIANASNNEAIIFFTPGDNGGSAIANYKYSLNSGSFNLFDPSQNTSPVTVTGLTNGTTYIISLETVNNLGFASSPSTAVTVIPGTVPSPPTNLLAISGNQIVTVYFTPGTSSSNTITNYEFSINGIIYTQFSPATNTSPITITGLTNSLQYTIYLKSVDSSGKISIASTPITFTPLSNLFNYSFINSGNVDDTLITDNIPIVNTNNSFTYSSNIIHLNSYLSNLVVVSVNYIYTDNGNVLDGLSYGSFSKNTVNFYDINTTNLNIFCFGNIPIARTYKNDGFLYGYQFSGLTLTISAVDIPTIQTNTSFSYCFSFSIVYVSSNVNFNWNIINVIRMRSMSAGLGSVFNFPVSNWNTSNVTDMQGAFYQNTSFNQNLTSWDTTNVTNMNNMFSGATNFNNGGAVNNTTNPLGWNTQNLTTFPPTSFSLSSALTKFNSTNYQGISITTG